MNVPQLRFSGFDGEWGNFELKMLVKLEGGATPLKSEKRYWQDGHIPWVSSQEVGPKKLDKTTFNITEAAVSETSTKMVDKDTLLLVVRSGILIRKIPLSITTVPMAINQDIKAMIIKDKKLHHLFLYQWMKKNEKAMLSNVVKGGTTVQSVNTPDLQDYLIGIPSIQEQNKIAYFFELIDGKVEKQQEKIEKLEQFKKGMMQKIFSQELRFKDGDGGEFPEWETTTFHEVADIRRGASPRPIKDPKWFSASSKIGWLRISDVTASGVYLNEVTQYLSEEGIKKSVLLEEPHLILSIAATIGKPVINKIPVCIHDGFIVFKNLKLNMLFGYYYLEHFQDKWLQFRQPGSQFNLNSDLVGNLEIMIPNNKEQQKIASFLSDIDKKLEKEKEKLIALEEQKKGFMQGMFV